MNSCFKEFLFFFIKNRKISLIVVFLATIFFSYFIKDIKFSSATNKFFINNDVEYLFYLESIKQFGSDNSLVVSIKGDDLFEKEKLNKLKTLIEELKKVPHIDSIDSIFNKQNFVYRDEELHTDVFIDPYNIPNSQKERLQAKQDAVANPLINHNLISDDGKMLLLNITVEHFDDSNLNKVVTQDVDLILNKYKDSFDEVLLFGNPYINEQVLSYIWHDTLYTIPFAIAVILLIILYNLKSFKLTLIPFTTSLISILIVLGFMGLTGIEFSMLTSIIPALIVLIGTTEDSYLVSEYVSEKTLTDDKDIIIKAISKKLGLAIILTTTTTVIGFASIYFNQIIVLQDFALVSSFGLFINFIITVIIVSNMLHGMKIDVTRKHTINYEGIIESAKQVYIKHTKKVYMVVAGVMIVFMSFVPNIVLDNNTLNYFKKDSDVRQRAEHFKTYTNGIQSFYIVVEAPKKKAFKEWKYLHELEKIENFLKKDTKFNYAISIADNLSIVNKEMMGEGDEKYYFVPKNSNLIAQYYMFFHRKDIKKYVSQDYKTAKIDVWHNIFSSSEFNKQKAILQEYIKNNIDPSLKVSITGKNVLLNKAADTIAYGQTYSVIATLFVVFMMISFVFKNLKAGVVILLGNLVPISILFGLMGMMDIPLNVVTAIIATITFGIVVDDTIHLMMKYKHESQNHTDKDNAVLSSIKAEGQAILLTTISLMLGFLTLTTSDFIPIIEFALLSMLVIFVAILSDLYFVPSLLKNINIIKGKK